MGSYDNPGLATMPVLEALDGGTFGKTLFKALAQADEFSEITMVTFSFHPLLELQASPEFGRGPTRVFDRMTTLAGACKERMVLVVDAGQWQRTDERKASMRRLVHAGAVVKEIEDLHAKIYLFNNNGSMTWMVGSANLSREAITKQDELVVLGHRPADYTAVRDMAEVLVQKARPISI